MLNFLRKLRRNDMKGKYLKYALGEIILVVIGILIAFQVNEWNGERKNRKELEVIMANMHDEFLENQKQLKEYQEFQESAQSAAILISSIIGRSREEIASHNIDSLFYVALPAAEFYPSSRSIENIVQSGRLGLIKDQALVNKLYQWDIKLGLLRDRENTQDDWINNFLIPFAVKHISFKEMDRYGNHDWYQPSTLPRDYYPVFQNFEFENMMDNMIYLQNATEIRIVELGQLLDDILMAIENY